ncbi:MAG: hypothetical protein Q4P36_08755 [Bowdeniella nasicola]|nr:hypothetical protein [Bowdeniella nasicola]
MPDAPGGGGRLARLAAVASHWARRVTVGLHESWARRVTVGLRESWARRVTAGLHAGAHSRAGRAIAAPIREGQRRVRTWGRNARLIAADLASSLPHWRDWTADYRYLTRSRLRASVRRTRRRVRLLLAPLTPRGTALDWAPPAPGADPGEPRDVVVLPGIYETPADLSPLTDHLRRAGHRVHTVRGLGRQLLPMPLLRHRVEAMLADTDLRDVVLLAHSKGGLIGKQVLMGPQGARVARLVAIATPWHGSRYAALFWPGLGVRSLTPGSALISAAEAPHPSDARIVSIAPAFDPHVPLGSALEGAHTIHVAATGHFAVLGDPRVIELVGTLVAQAPSGKAT